MASVVSDNKKRTIADTKPLLNAVWIAWIDSLHLDEHKPMEWEISQPAVPILKSFGDPNPYQSYKPGPELTITIKDDEKTYTQTFLQTEDGWRLA